MEWLTQLHGTVVAIDTAPFIYFVERHEKYRGLVRPLFLALDDGSITAVTSMLTVVEVLVQPLRESNVELAAKYRMILLGARNLTTLVVSQDVADHAAQLRARQNVKTPDAIQLATGICGGATTFITNDFAIKPIDGLRVIHLDELLRATD